MIGIVTAAAALLSTYACEIEMPRSLAQLPGETKLTPVGLPPQFANMRKFSIELTSAKQDELPQAKVVWNSDPINVVGEYPALPTAPGAFTLMAFSGGPCLFTEQACATTIQVVEQPTGPAKLLIMPAAIASHSDKHREPFVVLIEGQCVKEAAK